MKPLILAAVHDPGAWRMLEPALSNLRDQSVGLQLFLGPVLIERPEAADFSPRPLPTHGSEEELSGWLREINPSVLVTGTGWGSSSEQTLRNLARRAGLRSVTVVDYWANYLERWQGSDHAIQEIRDEVLLVDEAMHTEMRAAGFPSAQLHTTGHPFLEKLARSGQAPARTTASQRALFLSEPLRTEKGALSREVTWSHVQKVLKVLSLTESPALVQFKLHPKESGTPLPTWATPVDPSLELPRDFTQFDWVIGYQSMGLIEAALCGTRTVSIPTQPLTVHVRRMFERVGILVLESDTAADIESFARHFAQTKPPLLFSGATQACARLILDGFKQ